jgi:HSP20 family protein
MVAIVRRSPTRALRAWEPFYRPSNLLDEIERMAGEMWGAWRPYTYHTHPTPRMDMYEDKEGLVIKAELPGISKADIDISLEGDILTLKAEKKEEKVAEDTNYYCCERGFGQYSRSVSLPYPVDAEKISATFKNGLLEIRLPKTEEVKGKHIEVKVQ